MSEPLGVPITPKHYRLTALFDPGASSPITFPDDGGTIEVDTPLALISIHLEAVSGAESAEFLFSPIGWFDAEGRQVRIPDDMMLLRSTARDITILDVNCARERLSYNFAVGVLFEEELFTSKDPAIINKEVPDLER